MSSVLLAFIDQSNIQGAAKIEGGVVNAKAISETGLTDPFPGCNNVGQGGSMFPYLIDFGRKRGVNYTILNYAIGGAGVYDYCGRVGATVVGSSTEPAARGYMGPNSITGGGGVPAEGASGFDPFGLLARTRAALSSAGSAFDAKVSCWATGGSDAGADLAYNQAGLEAVANYMVNSGVTAHFIGMSSKNATATAPQFDVLQAAAAAAVAKLTGEGKSVRAGADMWQHYKSRNTEAPLYPENDGVTRVHLILRGQMVQAWLWDQKLAAAGL